jgi:hypothetical protein
MSRELYVYSESSVPVKRSDLDEACEALGWKYFLFEDFSTFRKLDGGSIPSCTILGWEDEEETTAHVQSAVSRGDIKRIDELFTNELVASATIDLELPFVPDPEMLSELAEAGVDEAITRRISSARLSYSVRTSAGRNDLSLQLQDIVANLLAVALYGVLEDPQTGEFENLDRDLLEDDS